MSSRSETFREVSLLDVKASEGPLVPELQAAFLRVLQGGQYILGPEVASFEKAVQNYLQIEHAIGVSSGTDALLASLMALDVGPGDEVITTAYSFFATAGCVSRLGAITKFVDIELSDYCMQPEAIEALITPKTKAIIAVHLFGQPCAIGSIMTIARKHGIPVIEDAAQAFGAQAFGAQAFGAQAHASVDANSPSQNAIGGIGELGCFSFFPSKNLGGFGDGGMVVTRDAALAERVRILRSHGSATKYLHEEVGGNFRLDALHAALLSVKLPYLAQWSTARRENARRYQQRLSGIGPDLILPQVTDQGHVWNQYVIRTPHRDDLKSFLKDNGVASQVYYPITLPSQPCFANLLAADSGSALERFPNSELAARQTLAIPIYPQLGDQLDYVADVILKFFSDRQKS